MSMIRQSTPLAASTCAIATLGIVTMNAVTISPAASLAFSRLGPVAGVMFGVPCDAPR
jgi:hypothetical protein